MTDTRRRLRAIGSALLLAPLLLGPAAAPSGADEAMPPRRFPAREAVGRRAKGPGASEGSGGWWLGTAGIALALAIFGGVSLASRRFLPRAGSIGFVGVVGRARLSTKHSIHLLRVGGRVLIVGTGPQGAPSLLGELTDPADLRRLAPIRPGEGPEARGFDRLLGDDE